MNTYIKNNVTSGNAVGDWKHALASCDAPRSFILPFRGEFGIKLLRHVCRVHAINDSRKVVICEDGDEALYPSALQHLVCPKNNDDKRRDKPIDDIDFVREIMRDFVVPTIEPGDAVLWPSFEGSTAFFIPRPFGSITYPTVADVVVCPRKRKYGASKNWPHWLELVDRLQSMGLNVVAAGAADSSDRRLEEIVPCAWTTSRPLDQTIHWMSGAKLIIATDNGLAHLSVWCGRPLLLISYNDARVAPGPVVDDLGVIHGTDYWPINAAHYRSENHTSSTIRILPNSWEAPDSVVRAAEALIAGRNDLKLVIV